MHTSSATQLQLDVPPHAPGNGSHTVGNTPSPSFVTQNCSGPQNSQPGTTSHSADGTHFPVQHSGVVSGSVPSGQSGVGASHTTFDWSQLSRSVSHTPSRHTAASTPNSEHSGCLHSFSQLATSSSTGTPSHAQQSLCSLQSASTSHSGPAGSPVVVDASVVVPGSLVDPVTSVVPGSLVGPAVVLASLVVVPGGVVVPGPVVPAVPPPVVGSPPVSVGPPLADDELPGSPLDSSPDPPPPGLHARRRMKTQLLKVRLRMPQAYHSPTPARERRPPPPARATSAYAVLSTSSSSRR